MQCEQAVRLGGRHNMPPPRDRKSKGLRRRNFAQGYPRSHATPTPTSRSRADVRDIRHTDKRTDDGRRWPLNATALIKYCVWWVRNIVKIIVINNVDQKQNLAGCLWQSCFPRLNLFIYIYYYVIWQHSKYTVNEKYNKTIQYGTIWD